MSFPVTGLNLPDWLRLCSQEEWGLVELLPASVDMSSGTTIFLLRLGLVHLAYSSKEKREGIEVRVLLSDGRIHE